jgi:CPA1 family monovalent cation:H+ antiporter
MPGNFTANIVELFVVLVALATSAALIVQRIRVPYATVLVVMGLAAALMAPNLDIELPPELILTVFLPGLVFESGYRLHFEQLRRTFGALVFLAVPAVLITAAVVAVVLQVAADIPLELGFLVGAMLAATDPAAVIATMKRVRAPARLATLIEGESVFNDGTAIVIFAVALAGLSGRLGLVDAGISLVLTVLVSIAIGALGGYLVSRLITHIDDHLIELSLTLLLAYGTYMVADFFHESGILATVVAAIVLGEYGRSRGMSRRTIEAIDTVWEFAAFLLTALLFLLIGLVISVGALAKAVLPIGIGIVAIVASRALVVYGILGLGSRVVREPRLAGGLPLGWLHVMIAAGMRGAVSVALALSLPAWVPQRALLVEVTFGVVLFTLIVQGLSINWVVARAIKPRERAEPAPDAGAA